MSDKIKILYLAANPLDTGHLQLQEEARDLKERIRQGPHRDAFEVIHFLAARPTDLLRGLQEVRPHILHFSGHASLSKEIMLQDDAGASRPIAPKVLADMVKVFKSNLRVVLLSACFGRSQANALHQVIDFTIGMNKPIFDSAAVSFSAAFYQVLSGGGSVKEAFEGARLLTMMEGRPAFKKADLLIRDGVDVEEPFVKLLSISPREERTQPKPEGARSGPSIEANNGSTIGVASIVNGNGNTLDFKGR